MLDYRGLNLLAKVLLSPIRSSSGVQTLLDDVCQRTLVGRVRKEKKMTKK